MGIKAEIITIGDEILYGQTLDTNSHTISGLLTAINIDVTYQSTIGDDEKTILKSLSEAGNRSDIIIITGGLGPTNDDLTKPTLCKYFGVGLSFHKKIYDHLESLFSKIGKELTSLNKNQAYLPNNCTIIPNGLGTAPGMWFEEKKRIIISVPGVPYEMKVMMKEFIIPKLNERYNRDVIRHKMVKTVGIAESKLAELIKDWEKSLPSGQKLAYLPSLGRVKLRITANGKDSAAVEEDIERSISKLVPLIDKYILGYDDDELESVIGKMLVNKKSTMATAESCTGGRVASSITSIPGSSQYFLGSIIAYSNDSKTNLLDVPHSTIEKCGAVSEEVVRIMATNVRQKLNSSIGLAISGGAGPGGGSNEKPVGTVWIAYSDGDKTIAKKMQFAKDRSLNIHLATIAVLNLLRKELLG